MQVAITIWPYVRKQIPDAELHLYYGFENWEKYADENQRKLIATIKNMIRDYEPEGVYYHGRISQDELAVEYLKSGVWSYPTWFTETSCISAMEAHAAGLRMVTSPIAALNETVGSRGAMIFGDWLSWGYQSKFTDAVVDAMNRTGDEDRILLQSYAKEHFSWDGVAQDWDVMLKDMVSGPTTMIIPKYKGLI
jgi:glycosyltransferase involved in cell wall biosynthesis